MIKKIKLELTFIISTAQCSSQGHETWQWN